MPTGDAGSPICGLSSETREEAMTGAWTVRPSHRAPWDVGGADKERERGARFSSQTAAQSTTESTTGCIFAHRRMDPAFLLVHPIHAKLF